jgi:hypothetical protein
MEGQHDKLKSEKDFVLKEGQRDLLCCNKKSLRCPSLNYEYVEAKEKGRRAFKILFDEMFK